MRKRRLDFGEILSHTAGQSQAAKGKNTLLALCTHPKELSDQANCRLSSPEK